MLIPALICAVLSAALIRGGFWSFLFLIPLGFAACAYGSFTAWLSWAAASVLNAFVTAFLYFRFGFSDWVFGVLYFTVMSLGFTWVIAGGGSRVRTLYRFIAAACAGAIVFLFVFLNAESGSVYREMIREQAELLSSAYVSTAADAVRRTLLEETLTPENVVNFASRLIISGGAVLSSFFLLFISRQASLFLAGIVRKRRYAAGLNFFHAPAGTIWVLSLSLGMILLFSRTGLTAGEYAAWNIAVICGILFLAQGAGIVLHLLGRRRPATRLLFNVLIIVVVFSPGINAAAIGVLILLGIAENWLPLRAPKTNASTPGQ